MSSSDGENLPIHALRTAFDRAIAASPGNVVVSSPTGSGKSTELPRWLRGRAVIVEPRRIACQSLATRVAALERTELGQGVGYIVRDDRRVRADTRLVFATPGIVLRDADLLASADTVVLDEFHERSLEGDLLLALLLAQQRRGGPPADRKLVVLSATLEGERVAAFVGGAHLAAEGRAFPVDVRFTEAGDAPPDGHDLVRRTVRAVAAAANDPGDVLVFLPGRAEIDAVAASLGGQSGDVLPLHGGLSLEAQRATFAPRARRKIILATNVAETSLTVPGIGVVIDGGLVRRTHYHAGRGFLALTAIAADSAAQRTGRAGRTAPGISYRLWGPRCALAPSTPPAVHRESLVSLVMAAAAFGERPEDLPFLDPPKPFALAAARDDLRALDALEGTTALSAEGRALFALPAEPTHGRLLSEARRRGCLEDAIDLVAALSVGRPLFLPGAPTLDPHDDLRLAGCDVTALVRAIRFGVPERHALSPHVLSEARRARERLRRASGLAERGGTEVDLAKGDARERLVEAAFAADPRAAHVVRTRGAQRTLSNGGTEIELARESALGRLTKLEAALVLESRALGSGRDAHVLATVCAAVPLAWLTRAGLGEDRVAHVALERGRVVATIERVFANKVLATREGKPEGAAAREAIATLFLRGSLFKGAAKLTRERLVLGALAAKIAEREGRAPPPGVAGLAATGGTVETAVEGWVRARLEALGVESADDIALLSASDLTAPELPWELAQTMAKDYPEAVSVGDATYTATYELSPLQVTLKMIRGTRKDPPALGFLPPFPGLRVVVDGPRGIAVLRAAG